MRRVLFGVAFVMAVLSLISTAALAQSRPPADATPGAVGITGVPLGGLEPVSAPGYRLEVVELTWESGAYATRHFHPTALITCVQEGALGFVLHHGAAMLVRVGRRMLLEPRAAGARDRGGARAARLYHL